MTFHLPDNTSLEDSDRLVRAVESVILKNKHVINTQSFVGIPSVIDFNGQLKGSANNLGDQFAEVRVNLTHKSLRDITSIEIVQNLRQSLTAIIEQYPEVDIQLVEDPPGPPVKATVLAEVYAWDNDKREKLTSEIEDMFKNTWDMAEVWSSNASIINEYVFKIDQRRVLLAGLSVPQISSALSFFLQGDVVNQLYEPDSRAPIPIRLTVPHSQRITPDTLAQTFVKNSKGESIPLSTVVDVVPAYKSKAILHKDNERVSYIGGELAASAPIYAVLDLEKRLNELKQFEGEPVSTANLGFSVKSPSTLGGYLIHWGGEFRLMMDAFRDMGIALGLSMLVIYFLLVSYYKSFRLSLLVMTSIPLGFIGVFPGHWLLGQGFSAPSMIGVIALSGVAVRNSLLIVDFIREQLAQGVAIDKAISQAGVLRIIPITLTTLAIVFGTMIIVPDPVMGGLAVSLIFGSISSSILTVFVVPLLYPRK